MRAFCRSSSIQKTMCLLFRLQRCPKHLQAGQEGLPRVMVQPRSPPWWCTRRSGPAWLALPAVTLPLQHSPPGRRTSSKGSFLRSQRRTTPSRTCPPLLLLPPWKRKRSALPVLLRLGKCGTVFAKIRAWASGVPCCKLDVGRLQAQQWQFCVRQCMRHRSHLHAWGNSAPLCERCTAFQVVHSCTSAVQLASAVQPCTRITALRAYDSPANVSQPCKHRMAV
jgi:hypothetical protein